LNLFLKNNHRLNILRFVGPETKKVIKLVQNLNFE